MIPVLIYLLLKKIRKQGGGSPSSGITSSSPSLKNRIVFTIMVLLLLLSCVVPAQQQHLSYKVMRNGTESGWVTLEKNVKGNIMVINLKSEIKVRMILLFKIISNEIAEFKDGTMVQSLVYRKMNETVKTNNRTLLGKSGYETETVSGKSILSIPPVSFNVLSMYFAEPSGVKQVYSDSQQQMATVEKTGPGIYKLHFPGGNTNEYHYSNGVCSRVKIDTTFYSAEFILTN